MFIGHFAVALAAKRAAPAVSAGFLVGAAMLADLLWPIFLILGWEAVDIEPGNTRFTPLAFTRYPISHSLLALLVWATLLAGLHFAFRRDRRGALVIAALVVSHWVLDAIVHRPDLPLFPGSDALVGLGIWNNIAATLLVEGALSAACVALYVASAPARDGVGRWGFRIFVAVLTVLYLGAAFGPPPPSVQVVAWSSLILWTTAPWAAWFDRHRSAPPAKRA